MSPFTGWWFKKALAWKTCVQWTTGCLSASQMWPDYLIPRSLSCITRKSQGVLNNLRRKMFPLYIHMSKSTPAVHIQYYWSYRHIPCGWLDAISFSSQKRKKGKKTQGRGLHNAPQQGELQASRPDTYGPRGGETGQICMQDSPAPPRYVASYNLQDNSLLRRAALTLVPLHHISTFPFDWQGKSVRIQCDCV